VFSNACETGVAIPSESVGRGWAGLAAAFIASGAVNYIGTL
jgi:CHAT domain-containing protein